MTEIIGRHAPQARALFFPGIGHMANMEAPQQVNNAVLEFWGQEI